MLQINWSNQLTKKDNSVRLLKVCKICGKILIAVFLELRFVMHWKQKIHFLLLSFEKKFKKKKIKLKFTSHKRKLNWLWAFWKYLTGLNFKNDCNSTFCHQRKWSEVLFIFSLCLCAWDFFFRCAKPATPPTDVHA